MPFVDIVNAVLADAFAEGKRADAKTWVQFRHTWLWDLEDWTFKYATDTVTFTSGSRIVDVADAPTDIHATVAMFDANGDPVVGVADFRKFFADYNANLALGSASPEAYTIVGGRIFLSHPGDGSSGIVVYEKTRPTLSADADTTGLPDGYDLGLVHGAKAEGFKLNNIGDLSANFDADFSATANTMRRAYLSAVKDSGGQFAAYRG